MTTDPEQLGLVGFALDGARTLKRQFPNIVFTSGRRTPSEQASAMADNIIKSGKRTWIAETYKDTPVRLACQRWVNANPKATTKPQLAAGLISVFAQIGDEELLRLSHHFSGRAFDVRPYCVPLHAFKEFVGTRTDPRLPGLDDFLDHEGGLERWHLEFVPKPTAKLA